MPSSLKRIWLVPLVSTFTALSVGACGSEDNRAKARDNAAGAGGESSSDAGTGGVPATSAGGGTEPPSGGVGGAAEGGGNGIGGAPTGKLVTFVEDFVSTEN